MLIELKDRLVLHLLCNSSFFDRTQLPVKSRNHVVMNAIEPSDMFEYISRHFRVYDFKDMTNIKECAWWHNLTIPMHESVGGLLDDKPVLCGGLTRVKRQLSKCYIYENEKWEVLADLGEPAYSHRQGFINVFVKFSEENSMTNLSNKDCL